MTSSVSSKIDIFLDIYESTFGQLPKSIKLPASDIRAYRTELLTTDSARYRIFHEEDLKYRRGVELRMDTKEIEEKNKKELEELRKLKESLENIKSVLKV